MPSYLRLQYREQAAARQELRLTELEDYEGAAQVRRTKQSGSLLALSRIRQQDYAMGRSRLLPEIGTAADWYHETDVADHEQVMAVMV